MRQNRRFTSLTLAVLVSSIGDPLSLTVSLILLLTATRSPLSIAGAYLCQIVSALLVSSLLAPISDRIDRRRLIVSVEVGRCLLVATLPVVTHASVFLLYPALLLLGAAEAVVRPARQAAVPELVGQANVGKANGVMLGAQAVAQSVGYAIAGTLIGILPDSRVLYLGDAATFGAAAALIATVGPMGGGLATTRISGGLRRALRVPRVPPLLLVAGGVVLCTAMLNPALLPLAFRLSNHAPLTYGVIQIALILGILAGSLVAGGFSAERTLVAMAASLWVFGATVAVVGASTSIVIVAASIFLSGVGNAGYSVTNLSALMRASTAENRGTVMAARVAATQAGSVFGLGVGALITTVAGPRATFLVTALLLFGLAGWYSWTLLSARERERRNLASSS
jgi:MFS family permease